MVGGEHSPPEGEGEEVGGGEHGSYPLCHLLQNAGHLVGPLKAGPDLWQSSYMYSILARGVGFPLLGGGDPPPSAGGTVGQR